jgi:hypothetical protein
MYKKSVMHAVLVAGYTLLLSSASCADTPTLTDAQIRERIIEDSMRGYPGNCPCPQNRDRTGRQCGARSAWSKPGGYTPICFPDEISDEKVREYRERLRA